MTTYSISEEHVYPDGPGAKSEIELDDGDEIIDARTAGRAKIITVAREVAQQGHVCGDCGASFDSEHGLNVHRGSQHD